MDIKSFHFEILNRHSVHIGHTRHIVHTGHILLDKPDILDTLSLLKTYWTSCHKDTQ